MTEVEAYHVHRWPLGGKGFILPVTGSESDFTPYYCANCKAQGIVLTEVKETVVQCLACGGTVTYVP